MTKTIGFVFVDRFADWEYGLLSASAVEWFGLRALALTPDGKTVRSMAGFTLVPERGIEPGESEDLDAVAAIGSDVWTTDASPDVAPLLKAVHARGGVVGGICAGTLALARAGLFENVGHTSNGPDWIRENLPDYPGFARYVDTPRAVRDGRIVSAPGSAPASFAAAFLEALLPDHREQLGEMQAMFAREHRQADGS